MYSEQGQLNLEEKGESGFLIIHLYMYIYISYIADKEIMCSRNVAYCHFTTIVCMGNTKSGSTKPNQNQLKSG